MQRIGLFIACSSFAVTLLAGTPAVIAQEDESDNIARMYFLEVKEGHGDQFNAGWKAYWSCVDENGGGNFSWGAWRPETGKLGGVLFRSSGHDWADFDEDDPAGEACGDVFGTSIAPHMGNIYSRFTEVYPNLSQGIDGEVKFVTLIDFDVESVSDALEMIEAFNETSMADGTDGYTWERNVTSFFDWDLRLALLRSNFADMAPDGPGFWERQAAHHGEEEAAELRARWRANNNNVRRQIWRRSENLSYSPSSE